MFQRSWFGFSFLARLNELQVHFTGWLHMPCLGVHLSHGLAIGEPQWGAEAGISSGERTRFQGSTVSAYQLTK